MESIIWSKSEEKWAYLLMLRGNEVHQLKLTGNMFTLKGKVQSALVALEQGQSPSEVGAKSVETIDVLSIAKAELSPGNGSLTLHGGPSGSKSLHFTTADDNADEILAAILERTGRTFEPRQEEIGVIEALIPPAFFGVLGGLLWLAVFDAARKLAGGEAVEAKGFRRRGLQHLLI